MKRGDISCENGTAYYTYRGKGGKRAKRELPRPAYEAIERALAVWGKSLVDMDPAQSLWPSRHADGRGLTSGTFYGNLRRHMRNSGLPPAGVHILRHSAAKLRRDAGESVEEVSRFLDHSSLAVTGVPAALRGAGGPELAEGRGGVGDLGFHLHRGLMPGHFFGIALLPNAGRDIE